jgi:uncharacterized protein
METSSRPTDRVGLLAFIAADRTLSILRDEHATRDAVAYAQGPDPTHDLEHALRVALWTIRLGGDEVDPREAVAAALLHDAVNLPKSNPERHVASERSAALARARRPAFGFDRIAVYRIADAIRDHSFSRDAVPDTPLGCALQDADRLESLGAIGLLRVISTGVRLNARWFDPDDPWAERRALDDLAYSLDHFFTKLMRIPATMRTEAGRREAARRVAVLRGFLTSLGEDLGAEPPPVDGAR